MSHIGFEFRFISLFDRRALRRGRLPETIPTADALNENESQDRSSQLSDDGTAVILNFV